MGLRWGKSLSSVLELAHSGGSKLPARWAAVLERWSFPQPISQDPATPLWYLNLHNFQGSPFGCGARKSTLHEAGRKPRTLAGITNPPVNADVLCRNADRIVILSLPARVRPITFLPSLPLLSGSPTPFSPSPLSTGLNAGETPTLPGCGAKRPCVRPFDPAAFFSPLRSFFSIFATPRWQQMSRAHPCPWV